MKYFFFFWKKVQRETQFYSIQGKTFQISPNIIFDFYDDKN